VNNQFRCCKIKEYPTHNAADVNELVQENFDIQCVVFSGKSNNYVGIAQFIEYFIPEKAIDETVNFTLKWVHILIPNVKRTLLGICHKIQGE